MLTTCLHVTLPQSAGQRVHASRGKSPQDGTEMDRRRRKARNKAERRNANMREVRREMCEHARGTARKSERIGGTPPPTEHAEGEETPPALSLPCDSAERRPMGKQQPQPRRAESVSSPTCCVPPQPAERKDGERSDRHTSVTEMGKSPNRRLLRPGSGRARPPAATNREAATASPRPWNRR